MIFLVDGHDNNTFGAEYQGTKEHDLVMRFNNIIEDYFMLTNIPYIRITADYRNATETLKWASKTLSLKYKVKYINNLSKICGATMAVETHFNACNGRGTGYEVLYYHKSILSKKLALEVMKYIKDFEIINSLKERSAKPEKNKYLLKATICPAIIIEPFFIDRDTRYYVDKQSFEMLAVAYAHTLVKVYNKHKEDK